MPDLPAVQSFHVLSRLSGLSAPVSRRFYLTAGVTLMILKYAIDAALIYAGTGKLLSPLLYLLPIATLKTDILGQAPAWVLFALVALTLPFAWIGASMSVRRAKDAGLTSALGLLFFAPFVNYLMMAALAALPSRPASRPALPLAGTDRAIGAALVGVAAGATMTVTVLAITSIALHYGEAAFVGVPFLSAATASFLFNLRGERSVAATVVVAGLTVLVGEGLLSLFAVEGAICLAMAAPIAFAIAIVGALFGRAVARIEDRRALVGPYAVLPVLAVLEPSQHVLAARAVSTTVDLAAPPEAVWNAVVAFPEIPATDLPAWYFRLGVAYPIRAHIDGAGVGAVRRCEFSTGAFVEPITTWDPPRLLAFDVAASPPTMRELSPWDDVLAPHVRAEIFRSERGEFRLEPLPGGGTRLTGTTWYHLDMAPTWYWTAWSDAILHKIHRRVLDHVGAVAAAS
jgi:hypothetical protein